VDYDGQEGFRIESNLVTTVMNHHSSVPHRDQTIQIEMVLMLYSGTRILIDAHYSSRIETFLRHVPGDANITGTGSVALSMLVVSAFNRLNRVYLLLPSIAFHTCRSKASSLCKCFVKGRRGDMAGRGV